MLSLQKGCLEWTAFIDQQSGNTEVFLNKRADAVLWWSLGCGDTAIPAVSIGNAQLVARKSRQTKNGRRVDDREFRGRVLPRVSGKPSCVTVLTRE